MVDLERIPGNVLDRLLARERSLLIATTEVMWAFEEGRPGSTDALRLTMEPPLKALFDERSWRRLDTLLGIVRVCGRIEGLWTAEGWTRETHATHYDTIDRAVGIVWNAIVTLQRPRGPDDHEAAGRMIARGYGRH